ncbi:MULTISPECIES: Na+/H+ antiporter subunit E [Rhizobium/Agrobacterium group]|jgi:multicomponent Na+:H+ antiporter subunit E|uniref:Na+/H+ antiporter subunit E n=1 Tax=Rhizobium/Agrobacterium group TaxID=227290 RepID=UPI00023A354C|nr:MULTISPECIES: Na+/H+ antiporter subunit E [Rhizobium/Agrobacterium group]EHJ99265.1 putative monovalent cation/H+ antiporter subunit E [Agrobacterium tumefaciens 5A]MDP9559351.1 multicomponent Na+:H+ antiporter subunit E [Rhizobium nepotum]KAA3508574.1 Na+/H+ antiporter subunit E [Agrobacterium tumefaciens]KAA3531168.1 Na+/H+ antiporter subunit E [Agrobacterium tumefaciens]MBO9107915.1 Na+/H+ antiporter subunit E [Agrobacterium sp. S2/73]
MSRYILLLLFVGVWLAVSGSVTPANILFGLIVSALALGLIRHQIPKGGRHRLRPVRVLSLLMLFFKELALSAWKVAVMVTRPKLDVQPGIFAYPLRLTTDFEITLLANLITLTPGTLSVDVSEDKTTLYVHAIDCSNIEAAKNDIRNGFEKKIMEAFQG